MVGHAVSVQVRARSYQEDALLVHVGEEVLRPQYVAEQLHLHFEHIRPSVWAWKRLGMNPNRSRKMAKGGKFSALRSTVRR
jgi:hypothetical protein